MAHIGVHVVLEEDRGVAFGVQALDWILRGSRDSTCCPEP